LSPLIIGCRNDSLFVVDATHDLSGELEGYSRKELIRNHVFENP
jgi:hypothetical protein